MKKTTKIASLLILSSLLVLITVAATTDGGKRFRHYSNMKGTFDRQFNVYYHTVHDTFIEPEGRGKFYKYTRDVDIAIYHIDGDSTTYLFNHKSEEVIQNMFIEVRFDTALNKMRFYSMTRDYDDFKNNENNVKREPSENMIVLTRNQKTNLVSVWKAHKTGKDLKRLKRLKKTEEFIIDVFNQKVIIVDEGQRKLTVRTYDY